MTNRSVMCGAAASVTAKALLSFSRCKQYLLQQIICGSQLHFCKSLLMKCSLADLCRAHRITPASQLSTDDGSDVDPSYYTTPKRRRLKQSIIPKAKVRAIQELSVGFVVDSDVPFTIFEHSFLRKLFNQFDRELVLQILWIGSSITRELQRLFEVKRDVIKADLQDALATIHLSFDL
jgi:hypothetical protein